MPMSDELSENDFRSLHRHLRSIAPGSVSPRGALDTISSSRVVAAVREVRSGRTVVLAAPVGSAAGPSGIPESGLLSPAGSGAGSPSVDLARDGIVGRGVLLDIPRLHGVSWLEPGSHVTAEHLAAAEARQGVRVTQGDILLVRVGHRRRHDELGGWDTADARAGLHPTAMEFLAERQVAALGSDGDSDAAPGSTRGVASPVRVLALRAMGLHLLDHLRFEDLAPVCAAEGRWSFLCVVAPLPPPPAAARSPVSALAIL